MDQFRTQGTRSRGLIGLIRPGPMTDPGITVGAVALMVAITALAAVAMTRR